MERKAYCQGKGKNDPFAPKGAKGKPWEKGKGMGKEDSFGKKGSKGKLWGKGFTNDWEKGFFDKGKGKMPHRESASWGPYGDVSRGPSLAPPWGPAWDQHDPPWNSLGNGAPVSEPHFIPQYLPGLQQELTVPDSGQVELGQDDGGIGTSRQDL